MNAATQLLSAACATRVAAGLEAHTYPEVEHAQDLVDQAVTKPEVAAR